MLMTCTGMVPFRFWGFFIYFFKFFKVALVAVIFSFPTWLTVLVWTWFLSAYYFS